MEEFEILDLEELSKEKGFKKAAQYLKAKLSKGFKVSVMIKKLYHISLPPLQQRKNEFFSKNHQPIEIVYHYHLHHRILRVRNPMIMGNGWHPQLPAIPVCPNNLYLQPKMKLHNNKWKISKVSRVKSKSVCTILKTTLLSNS